MEYAAFYHEKYKTNGQLTIQLKLICIINWMYSFSSAQKAEEMTWQIIGFVWHKI